MGDVTQSPAQTEMPALPVKETRPSKEDLSRLKWKKTVSEIFKMKCGSTTVLTVVTLIISIFLMTVILQVPTILYYNNQPSISTTYSIGPGIDFKTCSILQGSAFIPSTNATPLDHDNAEFCTEFSFQVSQNQACSTILLNLLQSLQSINPLLNNIKCQNSAIPFFCNAMQVLCSKNNTFMVGLEEECIQVRDYDCAVEWRAYEIFSSQPLPACTSFSKDKNITFSKAPAFDCPESFDHYCGSFCLPSCKRFFQLSTSAIIAENAIRITFIALGLLGGVFNLITCILNRRKMFRFPQIFIVYNTLISIITLLFLALPLIFDHSVFLCSESNVIEAYNNPTGYCQAQGFILHAGILCFGGFLLFHLAHLLLSLVFPFKETSFMKKYSKMAHVVEVIVVLVLGLLPGIIVLSTTKYQIDRFPPDTCYPNIEIMFHSFILPVIIYATIELAMLFTVFSVLRQHHQQKETSRSHKQMILSKLFCIGFSTPEKKLFILFWYYMLLFLVILTFFIARIKAADATFQNLEDYFMCSIVGYKPECDVYKEKIEEITRPSYYLDLFSYMITSAINLANLMYTLQIHDVKLFIQKLVSFRKKPTT